MSENEIILRMLIEFFVETKKSNQDLRKKLTVIEYFCKELNFINPKQFINEVLKTLKSKKTIIEYGVGDHSESIMVETQLEKYLSTWYNAIFAKKFPEKIMFDPLTRKYHGM